uniref:EGF-like domain-containing protein n=1 Tax=Echeneis naucrates TaxID=173247 RepID=A0A665TL51_ECHNA
HTSHVFGFANKFNLFVSYKSVKSTPPPKKVSQCALVKADNHSSNSGERNYRDASAVLPFIGLTSAEQSRSCCKNGGTCILGSFCACPPFFIGRSCEYDQRIRSCGLITHGEWVQKGCAYCRCGYGILHCFPNVFHKDCGKMNFADTCDDSEDVHWYHSSAVRSEKKCFLYLTLLLLLILFL